MDYFEDEQKKRGGVILEDGERCTADLVVAAEGWHGKSWGLIAGAPVPAKSSGMGIFRAAYPVELAVGDEMVAERFKLEGEERKTVFEMWIGYVSDLTFWLNKHQG